MYFENYYINLSPKLIINSISCYKNIMIKFILKFISVKYHNYDIKNELYLDAIVYSRYYLYWKTINCTYQEDIMNIIYDIEFIK